MRPPAAVETRETSATETKIDRADSGIRRTWLTSERQSLTFSTPDAAGTRVAARAAVAAAQALGAGYTLSDAVGGWLGGEEPAAILTIVGAELRAAEAIHRAARALLDSGCEAVQYERWSPGEYRCEEWRR